MTDVHDLALSTQEAAIASGAKALLPGVSDRVMSLFEAIRAYGPPRVALERTVYFTESFKTTEGQPLVWRWAKALEHIARNISVAIFDDELIVGRASTWLGRYSLVYPELDGSIMKAGAAGGARVRPPDAGSWRSAHGLGRARPAATCSDKGPPGKHHVSQKC